MGIRGLRRALCGVSAASLFASIALPLGAQEMRPTPPLAAAVPARAPLAAPQAAAPVPYDTFVTGATIQPGLLPIIHKQGRLYLAIAKSQLDQDFIEHSVPSNGLGGPGPNAGDNDLVPARILRFERVDDAIVMRWPNTVAKVDENSPQQIATRQTLPNSVVALAPIVAQNDSTFVISAQPFLSDVSDFARVFRRRGAPAGGGGYTLDATRSFFSETKAFPENDVIRVDQTWMSANPDPRFDTAPDGRELELTVTYNIIAAPKDGYVPRVADPRVGYFSQPAIDFRTDDNPNRVQHYLIRWNFAPADPTRPSKATHPAVFYLSNTIPTQYRGVVRDALLTWNDAFRKAGILDAVQVEQQPNDPMWDPEDIRHNMIRWINTAAPPFGAEALLAFDPRTGEELNVGVDVDAVEGLGARTFRYLIAPARGIADTLAGEREYTREAIRSVVLHESGHDFGLEHNFIGSEAYSAKQLQDKNFTAKYGIANSVMEYNALNLWPKGTPQGDFEQVVLGPYDYYAIKYGYAPISQAHTPQDEIPTLHRWASGWSNPMTRFAGDEDANFNGGHSSDPRVVQFDLTNDPLNWCSTQMKMTRTLMNNVASRFPLPGHSYEEAMAAFNTPLGTYLRCAAMPAHSIGGEYLSRAAAGDPKSTAPLTPVTRREEIRAWQMLSDSLFSDNALRINPNVLTHMTYGEYADFLNGSWSYNPGARHDVAIVDVIGAAQERALNEIFTPLRLQRIDELATKYAPGTTMSLTDLFDWSRQTIFGDISSGAIGNAGVVHRNLQIAFAKRLAEMWTSPAPGTPGDAQALARLQLTDVQTEAEAASHRSSLDELTRAHLGALAAIARQALEARANVGGGFGLLIGGF